MVAGPRGAAAILNHSVRLVARSYPWIAVLAGGEEGEGLAKLDQISGSGDPQELCAGLELLCVTVLQLLVELMGGVVAQPVLNEVAQWRVGGR